MIFYYSGTGNSAWAARQLARLTGDQAWDMARLSQLPDVRGAGQIGFVFPIYAWGAPEAVTAFGARLGSTDAFTFGVCTCGEDAGLAMKRFGKVCPLDSSYSLIMPNNYVVGSDLEDEEVVGRKIAAAREELHRISREILARERVYRVHEGALAGVKSRLANFGFNRFARSAKPFAVTDQCNGCGLCASHCPAAAISLAGGRPVWRAQCYQCMGCINACPQQAIQYGKATLGRCRYTIQAYLPQDEQV